ncbi:hypothetical protein ACLOJK_015666 [Asimina triloba]
MVYLANMKKPIDSINFQAEIDRRPLRLLRTSFFIYRHKFQWEFLINECFFVNLILKQMERFC